MSTTSLNLLVIGAQSINYSELFAGAQVNGRHVLVEHCTWSDLSLTSHGDSGGLVASIRPSRLPISNTNQHRPRSFQPHFVLLRAGCRGDAHTDHRPLLSIIAHAGIPTINSMDSFYLSQDKAHLYGKLLQVKRRLAKDGISFPLVSQSAYSDWAAATFPPDVPLVGKVGTASGGLGKMKIETHAAWEDFCSVMTMQSQVFSSEPFIAWDYDIRIQKIGNNYRAFRRTSKHWKSNVDIAMKDEDIPMEARYRTWLDEAAKETGMLICAMDVLRVESTGQEYILELNSSAIGLNGRHKDEDSKHIRDLVLGELETLFAPSTKLILPPLKASTPSNEKKIKKSSKKKDKA